VKVLPGQSASKTLCPVSSFVLEIKLFPAFSSLETVSKELEKAWNCFPPQEKKPEKVTAL